jgi:hypothetical protein
MDRVGSSRGSPGVRRSPPDYPLNNSRASTSISSADQRPQGAQGARQRSHAAHRRLPRRGSHQSPGDAVRDQPHHPSPRPGAPGTPHTPGGIRGPTSYVATSSQVAGLGQHCGYLGTSSDPTRSAMDRVHVVLVGCTWQTVRDSIVDNLIRTIRRGFSIRTVVQSPSPTTYPT